MAGKGPAQKPSSLRRRRTPTPGFRLLPHEGRSGDPPRWPIGNQTTEEMEVWAALWRLPQAVEWERMDIARQVARYVRTLVEAEMHAADSKLLAEVRQLEDRLGLTPRAMQTLRWETDEPLPESEPETEKTTPERAFVPKQEAS